MSQRLALLPRYMLDAVQSVFGQQSFAGREAHMYIALMQSSRHNEHHIVDHVAIGAVVQKLRQGLISLQSTDVAQQTVPCLIMTDALCVYEGHTRLRTPCC